MVQDTGLRIINLDLAIFDAQGLAPSKAMSLKKNRYFKNTQEGLLLPINNRK